MRAVVQTVDRASVTVGGEVVGAIGPGLLVLLGVTHTDTPETARTLARRVYEMRILDDEESAATAGAEVLVVSQFTLYADTSRGRRPGFTNAAAPALATSLVDAFAEALRKLGLHVAQGSFGAEMQVSLVNDGPFTIWLDTDSARA